MVSVFVNQHIRVKNVTDVHQGFMVFQIVENVTVILLAQNPDLEIAA